MTNERFVMAKSENKKKVVEYILNKFKPKHSVAF
jgi:hypothetical protein